VTHTCWTAACVGMLLALGACGGHDFDGTYQGDVLRVDQGSGDGVTRPEEWIIDVQARTLHRTRGSEACDLDLEGPDCSQGCYNKVVLAGQACTIDGQTLILQSGLLESQSSDIPDGGIRITMTWGASANGEAEIVDTGLLGQQD